VIDISQASVFLDHINCGNITVITSISEDTVLKNYVFGKYSTSFFKFTIW